MTDGKGYVSSLSYNAKLQPSSFQISGNLVSQSYDYYNDGRISVVHNTSDANFDRSYSYDNAGRLTEAKSGGLVNGYQYAPIPYHETFGYDTFSNLTGRASDSWGDFSDTDSASYSNNRRSDWGYDADGRNTTIDTRTNAFDAVGLQASMTGQQLAFNGSHVSVSQNFNYDADGAMAKEVSTQAGSSTNTYYLRSSVLGNAIVEELDSSGAKNVGYVYSPSGSEIANQSSGVVTWKHNTPAGTGLYTVNSYNSATTRTEFDPLGADVSLNAPESSPPNEGDGDIGANHLGGIMDARWSDFFNISGGCTIDGMAASCGTAMGAVNSGAAVIVPEGVNTAPRIVQVNGHSYLTTFQATPDGRLGYSYPSFNNRWETEEEMWVMKFHEVGVGIQGSPQKPDLIANEKDEARKLLAKDPCRSFVQDLARKALLRVNGGQTLSEAEESWANDNLSADALMDKVETAKISVFPDQEGPIGEAADSREIAHTITFYKGFYFDKYESDLVVNRPPGPEWRRRTLTQRGQTVIHEGLHLLFNGFNDELLGEVISGQNAKGKTEAERRRWGSEIIKDAVAKHCH
jgi:hypothetical protein